MTISNQKTRQRHDIQANVVAFQRVNQRNFNRHRDVEIKCRDNPER